MLNKFQTLKRLKWPYKKRKVTDLQTKRKYLNFCFFFIFLGYTHAFLPAVIHPNLILKLPIYSTAIQFAYITLGVLHKSVIISSTISDKHNPPFEHFLQTPFSDTLILSDIKLFTFFPILSYLRYKFCTVNRT